MRIGILGSGLSTGWNRSAANNTVPENEGHLYGQ